MPRKLKVYETTQGFYDLAVAAPSMKAALEAWGSSNNLFHHGFARQTDDSEVIAAAMARPGLVLRRPVGSTKPFREHSELPTAASLGVAPGDIRDHKRKAKRAKPKKMDEKAERAAAAAFVKEERKRELRRLKQGIAAARARERRKAAMEKAEGALEIARREHDRKAAIIEKDREAVDRRAQAEDERWQKLQGRLNEALRKASG
jgi:colicin import membrane protein